MSPLPVPVHPRLERLLGYSGGGRWAVFRFDPLRGELRYDDGRREGAGNTWAFLIFAARPAARAPGPPPPVGPPPPPAPAGLLADFVGWRAGRLAPAAEPSARPALRPGAHAPMPGRR